MTNIEMPTRMKKKINIELYVELTQIPSNNV